MRSIYFSPFLILVCLFFSGCPNFEDATSTPKRISLRFNVDNIGNAVGDTQDTLTVREIKFLVDRFDLLTPNRDTLRLAGIDAVIMSYNLDDQGRDRLIFEANLGVCDINTYDGIDFFVDQIKRDDNVFDKDLRTNAERFSVVLKGSFNDEEFVYKSKISFSRFFKFGPVNIGGNSETLAITVFSNPRSFITDPQTGEILSPLDESNSAQIDSLFGASLFIDASAESSLPLN